MSKEIFSLQALAEQMRVLETLVNQKLGEQKPTIDNLTFVWRAITLGVVGAVIISIFAIAWPTLQILRHEVLAWVKTLLTHGS
jgi:hypothetical protein